MLNERWILPDGIDEVLPPQAGLIECKRRELFDLYRSWGYEFVIPPFVEFLDSLLSGTGSDLDLKTFKLTDQLSGRMLGVRADITPQVARIDAHHYRHRSHPPACVTWERCCTPVPTALPEPAVHYRSVPNCTGTRASRAMWRSCG